MNPLFIIVCSSHPVYGMFELDLNSFQAQHWLFTVFSWEPTRHIWAYLGACWDSSRIVDTSVWTPCLPTAPMKYKAVLFTLIILSCWACSSQDVHGRHWGRCILWRQRTAEGKRSAIIAKICTDDKDWRLESTLAFLKSISNWHRSGWYFRNLQYANKNIICILIYPNIVDIQMHRAVEHIEHIE